jgi:LacI family transcriptional regulator
MTRIKRGTMRKASKLSEVAKLAGVSPITASRAIRGVGYVSEAARLRILDAAAQLNYTPDPLARRMRGEKSNLIGVFVNNYGSLVLHELIKAVSDEARPMGFDLIVFNSERFDRPGRVETSDLLSKLCDGLVLLMPNQSDAYLDVIDKQDFPCVMVNFDARDMNLPVVVPENRIGARTGVEHLLGLGHRRIAFVAGTVGTGQSAERQKGYADALAAAGVALDEEYIVAGAFNQEGRHGAAARAAGGADRDLLRER